MATADLLIVLHEENATAGTTHEWCATRGLSFEVIKMPEVKTMPHPEAYKAILVCGSDIDVNQTMRYPWLVLETKFLQDCVCKHKSIFGIGLGAQLLAFELGSKIDRKWRWEIGWYPVVDEIEKPLFTPFHFHKSTFELPKGAARIATNQHCKNQGFQLAQGGKSLITGLQFHPEVDDARLQRAVAGLNLTYVGNVQSKWKILRDASAHLKKSKEWYFAFLDQWWESVRRQHGDA